MVPLLIRLKATEPVITDRRTVGLPSVGGPPQIFESEVPPLKRQQPQVCENLRQRIGRNVERLARLN